MNNMYKVSSNPHTRSENTTSKIMLDVLIALIPASAFGIYNFGLRALAVIVVTIAACVLTELLFELALHKEITIGDLSATVTGLLLALNLPYTIPFWMAALGGIFAILIVKQLFGGLGQNFINPALAARCFLLISFASQMTSFTYDGVTSATPLAIVKNGGSVDIMSMFVGTTAGTIGETSTIALLIGGIYLLIKKVIDIRIPLCYIVSFAIFALLFSGNFTDITYLLSQFCGGGLMLGAFFMATDYVTSPVTKKGRIIFGIALGFLTAVFRVYGSSAEGVSYAIVFCNLLVPLIERITIPRAFGLEDSRNE